MRFASRLASTLKKINKIKKKKKKESVQCVNESAIEF